MIYFIKITQREATSIEGRVGAEVSLPFLEANLEDATLEAKAGASWGGDFSDFHMHITATTDQKTEVRYIQNQAKVKETTIYFKLFFHFNKSDTLPYSIIAIQTVFDFNASLDFSCLTFFL